MLVLSRKKHESIIIGKDIVITILDIREDKVRLGIDAPSDISVHRREVYDAIQRENIKSFGGSLRRSDDLDLKRPSQYYNTGLGRFLNDTSYDLPRLKIKIPNYY